MLVQTCRKTACKEDALSRPGSGGIDVSGAKRPTGTRPKEDAAWRPGGAWSKLDRNPPSGPKAFTLEFTRGLRSWVSCWHFQADLDNRGRSASGRAPSAIRGRDGLGGVGLRRRCRGRDAQLHPMAHSPGQRPAGADRSQDAPDRSLSDALRRAVRRRSATRVEWSSRRAPQAATGCGHIIVHICRARHNHPKPALHTIGDKPHSV